MIILNTDNSINNKYVWRISSLDNINPSLDNNILLSRKKPISLLNDNILPIHLINKYANQIGDINKFINLILEIIKNKKKIGILTDYDGDGITACIILLSYFKDIGIDYVFYVGDRLEGYGLRTESKEFFLNNNIDLLIILDSGTTNKKEIDSFPITTVIIDHHKFNENDSPVNALLLNPFTIRDSMSQICCTGGLVFLIIHKLNKYFNKPIIQYLDLVAIGTIADIVPLIGINRFFVKEGLKLFNKNNRLFFVELKKQLNISSHIDEQDMGFKIIPHINVLGRIGNKKHITLLINSIVNNTQCNKNLLGIMNTNTINTFGQWACKLNDLLQNITDEDFSKSLINILINLNNIRKIKNQLLFDNLTINNNSIITCLSTLDYSYMGVAGIVASKIVNKYHKTTLVCVKKKDIITGSFRSNGNLDVVEIINKLKDKKLLIEGGGHKEAGGIHFFAKHWDEIQCIIHNIRDDKPGNFLDIDFIILGSNLFLLEESIKSLRPFGKDNENPLFFFPNCTITSWRVVNNNHLELLILDEINNINNKFWLFFIQDLSYISIMLKFLENKLFKSNKVNICGTFMKNQTINIKDIKFWCP